MSDVLTPLTCTTFLAVIPDIQSALKFGGDGSVRIQLDVPESEMAGVMPLTIWTRRVLRITIEPVMQSTKVQEGDGSPQVATGRKRQPEGKAAKEQGDDRPARTRWIKDSRDSGQEAQR